MQAHGLVELVEQRERELADLPADPFDGHRTDLLGLRLRVLAQARFGGGQQHLERMDALDVGGHWDDSDDPASGSFGRRVGAVVADDDGGTNLARLRPDRWCQVHQPDFTASHCRGGPVRRRRSAPSRPRPAPTTPARLRRRRLTARWPAAGRWPAARWPNATPPRARLCTDL